MLSERELKYISKKLRLDIVEMAYQSQMGHIPSAFSIVEILTQLYYNILDISPKTANSVQRDRFILSKGHGCMSLYILLANLGFLTQDDLKDFGKINGLLGGHPSKTKTPGIEMSTGSLGHGPSVGVGMALSLRREGLSNKVCVLIGDGECNEGSVWEAALSAKKHDLDNFWIIVDNNKFQSYGPNNEICPLLSLNDKWESFGFNCFNVNLLDNPYDFTRIFVSSQDVKGPKCIICSGIKGLGAKSLEGQLQYHHLRSMSKEFKKQLIEEINNENNLLK